MLRSGGDYDIEHATNLERQAVRFGATRFRCLTDMVSTRDWPAAVPLKHGWPGWWSKIEAFRFPGPVLFLDLDTIITGDLVPLFDCLARHDFIGLRDVYRGRHDRSAFQSSVMAWAGDETQLYRRFRRHSEKHMAEFRGDQDFIERHRADRSTWQDVLPGRLASFKADLDRGARPVPAACSVVFFHGQPRPWQQSAIKWSDDHALDQVCA